VAEICDEIIGGIGISWNSISGMFREICSRKHWNKLRRGFAWQLELWLDGFILGNCRESARRGHSEVKCDRNEEVNAGSAIENKAYIM
jgi:hypothetical protein